MSVRPTTGQQWVQTDPNRTGRTNHYDPAGRLLDVTFTTGRVNRIVPDRNDNPTSIAREDPGELPIGTSFYYDVLDRVTNVVDDLSNQEVTYLYDSLGRPTNLIYPLGKLLTQQFDAMGRLTNQVFQFDAEHAFAASYTFDPAGRLVSRTYPNGIIQTNGFDPAGRLTNLVYQASGSPNPAVTNSLNISLTYAYDRNGNKTGSGEKGTLRWPLPPLTDESSTFTKSGRLDTRTITNLSPPNSPPLSWTNSYDDSGNLTRATSSTGAAYSLAYDEDNRTTSIRWQSGTTNTVISNRYDALGRRVARSVTNGGETTETRYVLNLVGGMERILCDADAGGSIAAWYVHGPDLAFRLDAQGNLLCYHADAQANVIALTGAGGTNLFQYAYTPYGRVLGTTNYPQSTIHTSQPYKFVGSQGVMEELPGLYFMRARYYSADAGVFLSTDPVKKIGPGWKPIGYEYSDGNPHLFIDPRGTYKLRSYLLGIVTDITAEIVHLAADALDTLDRGVGYVDKHLRYAGGATSDEEYAEEIETSQVQVASDWDRGTGSGKRLVDRAVGGVKGMVNWAMSDPTPLNGGSHANSTPMTHGIPAQPIQQNGVSFQINGNGGRTSGTQSVIGPAVDAGNRANGLNFRQSQGGALAVNFSGSTGRADMRVAGSTPPVGNLSSGGSSGSWNAPKQPDPPPTIWSMVKSWIGGLFGRGK